MFHLGLETTNILIIGYDSLSYSIKDSWIRSGSKMSNWKISITITWHLWIATFVHNINIFHLLSKTQKSNKSTYLQPHVSQFCLKKNKNIIHYRYLYKQKKIFQL